MGMEIYRAKNQIGGDVIEVSSPKTKILLDVGMGTADTLDIKTLDLKSYDAVFIFHYHTDHMGLAYNLYKNVPIYMGEVSYKIVRAANAYRNRPTVPLKGFLKHRQTIRIGDMKITPYLCCDSIFDSYMLLIERQGERLLFTGDFGVSGWKRRHGIGSLPKDIDILITRSAALSKDYAGRDEKELLTKATKLFQKTTGPIFVLQSSMNLDRILTMYKAAKRSRRLFLQELYMAEITSAIRGCIPNPMKFSDVKVFVTTVYKDDHRIGLFKNYKNTIKKEEISKENFVMCIRTSMYPYVKSLFESMGYPKGLLVYSFWSGYRNDENMQSFLENCTAFGLERVDLHTSGYAESNAIKKLLRHTNPKKIMSVEPDSPLVERSKGEFVNAFMT